tara:strand:- start:2 stop:370 length:369 start_codon:yes stop_codon:yes gene_type:complete
MADLKIPNLNKNSDKFVFKKKLTLRRKSKRKLIKESFFMFLFGILIIYLIYLIPDKKVVFENFLKNFTELYNPLFELISKFYEICLAIIIIISLIFALILILGGISRLLIIMKRKSRQISFK